MRQFPNTNVHQEVKSHIKTSIKNNPLSKIGAVEKCTQINDVQEKPGFDKYTVSNNTREYVQGTWLQSSMRRSWVPSSLSSVASLKSKLPKTPTPACGVWILQRNCRELIGKSGLKKGFSDFTAYFCVYVVSMSPPVLKVQA